MTTCGGGFEATRAMAIMAPSAPEPAFRCCSTGLAFCAAEGKNSTCPMLESNSSSAFHHHIDWQTLQATPNSHTTMAMAAALLGSPGVGNDWEQQLLLLNHSSGGFELPLWSSKTAGDDVVVQSGDAAGARRALRVLEAVEGTRGDAALDALLASVVAQSGDAAGARRTLQVLEAVEGSRGALVASAVAAAPPENSRGAPCSEVVVHQTGPSSTSPHHGHGDDHPAATSLKRNPDRSSPDPKGAEAGECVKRGKRCRKENSSSSSKAKRRERSCSETSGESGGAAKEIQQPQQQQAKQEYIHVRARRGQATDSHSLAERVRREKMSERMKFLQDLVPGCRKVTGKAVMLDEIINYVQSLQRQVESLSMKLAAVSPAQQSSHWTLESLLSNKEILHSQFSSNSAAAATVAAGPFGLMRPQQPLPAAVIASPLALPFGFNGLENVGRTPSSLRSPVAGFADLASLQPFDSSVSQFTGRDGELESIVQMGLHQQGQLGSFAGHLQCQLPVGRMKVEY